MEITINRERKIKELLFFYSPDKLKETFNLHDDIEKLNDNVINSIFNEHCNKYKEEIEIKELYDNFKSSTYLISTPDNFCEIGSVIKKSSRKCYKVSTLNKHEISCSYDHLIETNIDWKLTAQLNDTDYIRTIDGFSKINNCESISNSVVYDLEVLHENHRYWGGTGISSHNTGKTLLALAAALHQMKHYNTIMLARPIVPLSNKDIGFLPGDVKEKISPYMEPLFDNLSVIKYKFKTESAEYKKIEMLIKEEKLIITPLAYIRGRSLAKTFFIVDEAQNLTPHEVKTIITRAAEGTKIVFTGDIHQIDSPYLDMKSNGLTYLTDRMKGYPLFSHINLIKGERSYLAELASKAL